MDRPERMGRPGGRPSGAGWSVIVILLAATGVLFVSLAGYAYERLGIPPVWYDGILIGSLLGSRVDIPVWRRPDRVRIEPVDVLVSGVPHRVLEVRHSGTTTLAVNVGGAVVPTAVSVYLIVHDSVWARSLVTTLVVAIVAWLVARPVPGVGIVVPALLPPAIAALTAIAAGGPSPAAVAYVGGTLGTLVGADLLNLPRIRGLGARVASIGGAGTFDGIFLSGVLAVIMAGL